MIGVWAMTALLFVVWLGAVAMMLAVYLPEREWYCPRCGQSYVGKIKPGYCGRCLARRAW